jgi:predicted glycosyltransferase involved in capsule biosynthesis
MINKKLSDEIMQLQKINIPVFTKGVTNKINGIHIPFLTNLFQNYNHKKIYNLRGCNMAFWKKDLLSVNGYNEEFTGWGREDSELVARLFNLGITKRTIKFGGIVFHLNHPENSRNHLNENESVLKNTLAQKKIFCDKGINQFL